MPTSLPSPPAELTVDADGVRRLLTTHAPHLAHLPLGAVHQGWDNLSFRLGDALAVRIPRRVVAAALALHEHRWLPRLAPGLPLPLPVPVWVGPPTPDVPWPWAVVPWLTGSPTHRRPLDGRLAAPALGRFFRALHRPAPPDAPRNPFRGVPLADVAARTLADLQASAEAGLQQEQLTAIHDEGLRARSYAGPPAWIHGDPHPANVLADDRGGLVALIDWGDLAAGDPATDLAAAWMHLDVEHHDALWAGYGGVDADTWRRARAWAVRFGVMLLRIGVGDPAGPLAVYERVGRVTIERVLASRAPGSRVTR